MKIEFKEIRVDAIEQSPRVRVREGKTHDPTVSRYTEAYESRAVIPAMVVFNEPGTKSYILADASHQWTLYIAAKFCSRSGCDAP